MSRVQALPRIHRLPQQLAHQIAAGEVVERPASVIKELLENAIDAGARQIRIDVDRGGIARMRVADNGHGIHPDDLELLLERHSTSKLHEQADLSCLQTLGFRGEALGAIASVSRFTIHTATDDSGRGMGLCNTVDAGVSITPVARRRGTTVEVHELFYNTPARRKFLRSEWTEYQHIQNVIRHIVLSHFEVSFTVYHNNRRVMQHPPASPDYEQRVAGILGKAFTEKARAVDFSDGDLRLWGWLGDPEQARNRSDQQYVYLNGRAVRDQQVSHAIRIAYADAVYPGRYPGYVLYLEMAPQLADINVHPAKYEVRFSRARDVHDFIHAAVSRGLDTALRSTTATIMKPGSTVLSGNDTAVNETTTLYTPRDNIPAESNAYTALGSFRCVVHERFVIFENAAGMTLLDMHAARIRLAETALAAIEHGEIPVCKPLLFPLTISCPAQQLERIEAQMSLFNRYGIGLVRQGPEHLALRSLPTFMKQAEPELLLNDLVAAIRCNQADSGRIAGTLMKHINDRSCAPGEADIRSLVADVAGEEPASSNPPLWRQLDDSALAALLSG